MQPNDGAMKKKRENIFTSILMIEKLFTFDKIVGETLEMIPSCNEQVKSYLESYNWLASDLKKGNSVNRASMKGHALHVYTVFKRLTFFYASIRGIFNSINTDADPICKDRLEHCGNWKFEGFCENNYLFMINYCPETCGLCGLLESIRAVKEAEANIQLPNFEDFSEMVSGLGRLQKIYGLPIDLMRRGTINAFPTSVELSTWDCLQLAHNSLKSGFLSYAWIWFQEISTTAKDANTLAYVQKEMQDLAYKHDKDLTKDDNHFRELLSKYPNQRPILSDSFHYCKESMKEAIRKSKAKVGETFSCELTTRGVSFFILQPLKQETITAQPEIILFHDVISDTEIETLKLLSIDHIDKDPRRNRRTEAYQLNMNHSVVNRLDRRAEMLSGLVMYNEDSKPEERNAEPLKVRNYCACGDFGLHSDTYYKHEKGAPSLHENFPEGDRMGTVIYYMNDVLNGGDLLFPRIRLTITPKKGTAILFYSLKKNGNFDKLSAHASCPVSVGEKWVAVKWFREGFNFRSRPCSTNPDE
ncbi:prolyl 4-hydroxylase subunit alpha-1-like isoform X2 [Palaemon carinicauda]